MSQSLSLKYKILSNNVWKLKQLVFVAEWPVHWQLELEVFGLDLQLVLSTQLSLLSCKIVLYLLDLF